MLIGKYTLYYESPLDPWSTLIPLLLVLTLSMCKEGAEDLKRHRADRETNNRIITKIVGIGNNNPTVDIYWKDVRVGDILLLPNNSEIPADMILLASSDDTGITYIETSNIDGETNLKIKTAAHTAPVGSAWKHPTELAG